MATDTSELQSRVRYEADDRPPALLAAGLGLQLTVLTISGIVITPLIVIQAAGGSDTYMMWAVFGSVVVSGISTILQAVRVGRIGAGYVLLMGTSGAFIAICITAIAEGGPAMLATLVIISSLFQFVLARRLSLFRRVLTPTVAGTVIMLIPVTVMPIIFDLLGRVPDGTPAEAAPLSALVTLLIIVRDCRQGDWRAPTVGTRHRRRRRIVGWRVLRNLRHGKDFRSTVDRFSGRKRVARL